MGNNSCYRPHDKFQILNSKFYDLYKPKIEFWSTSDQKVALKMRRSNGLRVMSDFVFFQPSMNSYFSENVALYAVCFDVM